MDSMEGGELSAHDVWVFFLATVFGRVVYLDVPLAAYVQHGSNAYGWKKLSYRSWLKYIFRNRAAEISNFANVAENRATLLNVATGNLKDIWQKRAAASAVYYQKLNLICTERSRIYTCKDIGDRVGAFSTVLRRSGYAGAWGLGRKAFILDTCVGIPIGPFLPSRL
jgi:hypothetical protein